MKQTTKKFLTQLCLRFSAFPPTALNNNYANAKLACVASVSVEQRAKNGVFGVLPARKMRREQKWEGGGFNRSFYRPVILCSRTAQKRLLRRLMQSGKLSFKTNSETNVKLWCSNRVEF